MSLNFWLKSNNGKNFNLDSLQELIKDNGIADNPKLEMLFSLFDTDHDGKISTVNSKGEKELKSIFDKFHSAAGDNNILEEDEVSKYLTENNLDKDLSVNDVLDFLGKFIKADKGEETASSQNKLIQDIEAYNQNRAATQSVITEAEINKIKKEAYNTILTSTVTSEKLEKDYETLFDYVKEKLSKSGKNPTLEEMNLYSIELQLLNPDIKADKKVKKGTSINITSKSIDRKTLQLLETKGIKIEKDNYIFFQKLLELDDKKRAFVLDAIKNSKFRTKDEIINEAYTKTRINLADTGLTIKVGNGSSTLENFITKTLKLDLNSKEGLKIYDRLSRIEQKELNSLPKEFIDKLSKMNNVTFDKFADKAEVFGIILRTDEEMKDREKNSQEYRDLKARIFMAQYVADNYTSAVTISQSADRNLNFTQGAWWLRNARPIGYTANEEQKRDTSKVNQIKKLIQDADTLTNEEFAKKMSNIMEAKRTVSVAALPGDLPVSHEAKDPSFKFDSKLAYTFMKQMQRAELAATVAKRLEPERKQNKQNNPNVAVAESTRVYNPQQELMGIEYTVKPLNETDLKQLKQYINSIKTRKELFLFAKSLHYKTNVMDNKVETMIPKENQAEIAKLLAQKARKLGFAEITPPEKEKVEETGSLAERIKKFRTAETANSNKISINTFRDIFTKPIDKKLHYPKTNDKTIMETYEATKTKLLGSWDPVGEQIRTQEMEGTLGGVLDIATMILVTKGMGSMGTFVKIGNVGRNIGTATNIFKTANVASRWTKNAKLINNLAKADKALGGLWINGNAGALHGFATMSAYGGLQGTVGMADNTVKNLLEGKNWSDGLGERFEQTLDMSWENGKFGLFAGYSGVLAQALGKGTMALGTKGVDKLFKTNYSKTLLDKVSNVVTEEGISGSEFWTKMHAASPIEEFIVNPAYETGFFTLYRKLEESGVDFNNEESLLSAIEANLDEDTKKSLGATYVSEGGNLAMFKMIGSLIQWAHIGRMSSSAAVEIQARNNRALKNINMRKFVENGKESYIVKFNENDKPITCNAEELMQRCEHKIFCADVEDKAQKDGSFKLPNNQTIEYDKTNNRYKTVIDADKTIESTSVEDLLAKINQNTVAKQIEQHIETKKEPFILDDNRKITKGPDGIYRLVITIDGKQLVARADAVEKLLKIGTEYDVDIQTGELIKIERTEEPVSRTTNTISQTNGTSSVSPKETKISLGDEHRVVSTTGLSGLANRATSNNYAYSVERAELTEKLADKGIVEVSRDKDSKFVTIKVKLDEFTTKLLSEVEKQNIEIPEGNSATKSVDNILQYKFEGVDKDGNAIFMMPNSGWGFVDGNNVLKAVENIASGKNMYGREVPSFQEFILTQSLERANDREAFVSVRDKIKNMPVSDAKSRLMEAYTEKYNAWSSNPARPDIRMQYIPVSENPHNIVNIETANAVGAKAQQALAGSKHRIATAGYSAPPEGYETATRDFLRALDGELDAEETAYVTSPTADKGSIDAITSEVAGFKDGRLFYTTAQDYVEYINPDNFPESIDTQAYAKVPKFVLPDATSYSAATAKCSNAFLATGGRNATVSDFVNAIENGNKAIILENTSLEVPAWGQAKSRVENASKYLAEQIQAVKDGKPLPYPEVGKFTRAFIESNMNKLNDLVKTIRIDGSPESINIAAKQSAMFLDQPIPTADNPHNIAQVTTAQQVGAKAQQALAGHTHRIATAGYSAPPEGYETATRDFLRALDGELGTEETAYVTSPTADKGSIDAITSEVAGFKDGRVFYTTAQDYVEYINPENFPASIDAQAYAKVPKFVLPDAATYSAATAEASNAFIATGGRNATVSDFVNAIKKGNKAIILDNTTLEVPAWGQAKGRVENASKYLVEQIQAVKDGKPLPYPEVGEFTRAFIESNLSKLDGLVKTIRIDGSPESIKVAAKQSAAFLDRPMPTTDNPHNIAQVTTAQQVGKKAEQALAGHTHRIATAGYSAPPEGYETATRDFLRALDGELDANETAYVTSPTADKGSIDAITSEVAGFKDGRVFYTTAQDYVEYINPDNFPSTIDKKAYADVPKFVLPDAATYSAATAEASNAFIATGGRNATVSDFVNAVKKGNKAIILENTALDVPAWGEAKNRVENASKYLVEQIKAVKEGKPLPYPEVGEFTRAFIEKNMSKIDNIVRAYQVDGKTESINRAATQAAQFIKGVTSEPTIIAKPKISIDSPEFQSVKAELTDLYKKKNLSDTETERMLQLEAEVQAQGILVARSPIVQQTKISMLAKAEPREAFLPDFSNEAQLKEMGFTHRTSGWFTDMSEPFDINNPESIKEALIKVGNKYVDGKWYNSKNKEIKIDFNDHESLKDAGLKEITKHGWYHTNLGWYPDPLSDKDVVYVFKRDASGKPIDTGFGPKDELPSLYVRSEDFDNNNMKYVQPSEMTPGKPISVKKCASGTFCILPAGTKLFSSEGLVEVKSDEIVNIKEAKNSIHTSKIADVPDMYKADPLNPASKELFDLINEYKAKEPTMNDVEKAQWQTRISEKFNNIDRGQQLVEILGTGDAAPKDLRGRLIAGAKITKDIDAKYLSRIDCSDFDKGIEQASKIMDEILADKTLNAAQKQAYLMSVMVGMITTSNLHQHVKGSAAKETTLAIARKKGMSEADIKKIEDEYAKAEKGYDDLPEFNLGYDIIGKPIQTTEDYKTVIRSLVRDAMRQGQLICEVRCACDTLRDPVTGKNLEPMEGAEAIVRMMDEVADEIRAEGHTPPEMSYVILTFRGKGWDGSIPMAELQADIAVKLSEKYPDRKFGYDVAGPEKTGWGPKAFKGATDIINKHNEDVASGRKKGNAVGITMHAGESPTYEGGEGWKSVLDAIEMGAVRIGHGVQLAKHLKDIEFTEPEEFNRIVTMLKEKGITIEICNGCNVISIPENSEGMDYHAIQIFLDYGIPVTICTDNDAICSTNVRQEYTQLLLTGHSNFMDWNAIKQSVRDGVDAAFITDAQKTKVRTELETRLAKVQKLYDEKTNGIVLDATNTAPSTVQPNQPIKIGVIDLFGKKKGIAFSNSKDFSHGELVAGAIQSQLKDENVEVVPIELKATDPEGKRDRMVTTSYSMGSDSYGSKTNLYFNRKSFLKELKKLNALPKGQKFQYLNVSNIIEVPYSVNGREITPQDLADPVIREEIRKSLPEQVQHIIEELETMIEDGTEVYISAGNKRTTFNALSLAKGAHSIGGLDPKTGEPLSYFTNNALVEDFVPIPLSFTGAKGNGQVNADPTVKGVRMAGIIDQQGEFSKMSKRELRQKVATNADYVELKQHIDKILADGKRRVDINFFQYSLAFNLPEKFRYKIYDTQKFIAMFEGKVEQEVLDYIRPMGTHCDIRYKQFFDMDAKEGHHIMPMSKTTLVRNTISGTSFAPGQVIARDIKAKKKVISDASKVETFRSFVTSNVSDRAVSQSKLNLAQFSKNGIPLEYSRESFIRELDELLSSLSTTERAKIESEFGIKIENTTYNETGKEIVGIPRIPKEITGTPNEQAVARLIRKFTVENEVKIADAEIKELLESVLQTFPEFAMTVGKKQHSTHAYSVDIHTLKNLQDNLADPKYVQLDAESQLVLKYATILHDIGKRFLGDEQPDHGHADLSTQYAKQILERFDLSDDVKVRILKQVEKHHWFEKYCKGGQSPEEIARVVETFDTMEDLTIAEIMAKSDYQNVNEDFHLNKWRNWVEGDGLMTKAEFDNYMAASFSKIDSSFAGYKEDYNRCQRILNLTSKVENNEVQLMKYSEELLSYYRLTDGKCSPVIMETVNKINAKVVSNFFTKNISKSLINIEKNLKEHYKDGQIPESDYSREMWEIDNNGNTSKKFDRTIDETATKTCAMIIDFMKFNDGYLDSPAGIEGLTKRDLLINFSKYINVKGTTGFYLSLAKDNPSMFENIMHSMLNQYQVADFSKSAATIYKRSSWPMNTALNSMYIPFVENGFKHYDNAYAFDFIGHIQEHPNDVPNINELSALIDKCPLKNKSVTYRGGQLNELDIIRIDDGHGNKVCADTIIQNFLDEHPNATGKEIETFVYNLLNGTSHTKPRYMSATCNKDLATAWAVGNKINGGKQERIKLLWKIDADEDIKALFMEQVNCMSNNYYDQFEFLFQRQTTLNFINCHFDEKTGILELEVKATQPKKLEEFKDFGIPNEQELLTLKQIYNNVKALRNSNPQQFSNIQKKLYDAANELLNGKNDLYLKLMQDSEILKFKN